MERAEAKVCYDFVNAKVRGMRSKLYEGPRLLALAQAGTLPEIFHGVYPAETFSGYLQFERKLAEDHVRDLKLVSGYLSGALGELFAWLLVGYQVENAKVALRLHWAGGDRRAAEEQMIAPTRALTERLDKLLQAPTLAAFAQAMPVPELRDALLRAAGATPVADSGPPPTALFDMALDSAYLRKLVRLASPFDGWIRRLTAFDVDGRNVLLLLRARFGYDRPLDEVRPFLTPGGVYFRQHEADRLAAAPGLGEALAFVEERFLPPDLRRSSAGLPELEDALQRQQYRLAVHGFAESVIAEPLVVAFFYIKRAELANLVRLTESLRHGLSRDEIGRELLVLER